MDISDSYYHLRIQSVGRTRIAFIVGTGLRTYVPEPGSVGVALLIQEVHRARRRLIFSARPPDFLIPGRIIRSGEDERSRNTYRVIRDRGVRYTF